MGMKAMCKEERHQATSTELTGGLGFTYEDTVVGYYLASLLREERAAGLNGIVKSVAVQQAGHGYPMDDIVVEFDDDGSLRKLSLQAKRTITISAAVTNTDFRDIISCSVSTRLTSGFNVDLDAYGFVVENVAKDPFRTLNRLIEWAKSSPSGEDFARRFAPGGTAAAPERSLRDELSPLIGIRSSDDERNFYAQFVALNLNGLTEGGFLRTEVINRLQELVAANKDGHDLLLFDRLCRIARDGAGTARKWTRQTLLAELRDVLRLKIAPNYLRDINLLQVFSAAGMADISEEIAGFRVERSSLEVSINNRFVEHRLVNITGLPGCGKSAMLKHVASIDAANGPILFLKSDRLAGNNWLTFAAALGLQHHDVAGLLAEIGATGTPILFIDGIDRVKPDQKNIITDILRVIEENQHLAAWKVLASSRDQGLEAYRAWFPPSFYRGSGIGDVTINAFSDEEAEILAKERPNLRRLLFGAKNVKEIARRPFFAAVLARSFPDDSTTPQTEIDLISAWWARAGHDAPKEAVPQRQRALLDLVEKGVRNLGKGIQARGLKDSTFEQIQGLIDDFVIHYHDEEASYSYTHDIFFEWVFSRYLIELGDDWTHGLADAGEPPLLGRVVGLLAQNALTSPGKWSAGYRNLERKPLRPQWRREWLTAPPFTPAFAQGYHEFQNLLVENNYVLFEKLLVWFQAQHTIPSPIVLQNSANAVEGLDVINMADLLGWPSDFESWGRFLGWLLPLAPSLPTRLFPNILEIVSVWQNVFADMKNPLSSAIINICASWLIELEIIEYSEHPISDYGPWGMLNGEARSGLVSALRSTIMRSARSYPAPAIALFKRALANEHMRRASYSNLMGFTPTMADVEPELVVAVAKAELMEELPQERIDREKREDREYVEFLKRLRAIPEEKRTEDQKRALQHIHMPIGHNQIDHDDIGIVQHHNYYFPASPIHEPFASLFAKKPEAALGLVRDLTNHATKGWRQIQLLNHDRMGTPISLILEFPWGKQEFWGNWHVYIWFIGQPTVSRPLECAFLALGYWAFKQIQGGQSSDEIIRAVVEGNECYAVLGLALVLALETYNVSEATFPIVTCQRLWRHDIARFGQEPTRDIDLLGVGYLAHLTGDKAKAKEFLDSRQSRKREIRELAMRFALTADEGLRQHFKEAITRFPDNLPYEVEEQRSNVGVTAEMKEQAEQWAGLGDIVNYRRSQTEANEFLISYESPKPLTAAQEERLKESTTSLQEYSVIEWAMRSLQDNALVDRLSLTDAVAFAQTRDNDTIFIKRKETGEHAAQSTISAVAAIVIRFGPHGGKDYDWAWDVMDRVAAMEEPENTFFGSEIPWHPANHLIVALVHDRRSSLPREDSIQRLFELTAHPMRSVAQFAFCGLFMDSDEHVQWVAAHLAMDLSLYYRFEIKENGDRDQTVDRNARRQSLARALERLGAMTDVPLTSVPPAWVEATGKRRYGRSEEEARWDDAYPMFDASFATQIFPRFPIENWCQSCLYKPMIAVSFQELVRWTAERLMPPWLMTNRSRRSYTAASLTEWNAVLGDLLARAAPFFETEFVRKEFLAPFLTEDKEGLAVLAEFANKTVTRQILDATTIPANTFDLLNDCVDRVVRDPCFEPKRYRAGEVYGYDLPKLIKALLFVPIDKDAPGATRFANGDWSQISMIMPIVAKLITATGWSTYVMQHYLTLCERAGLEYPLAEFADQANAILDSLSDNAKVNWSGTMLLARTAATVQRLADANFPLDTDNARKLLKVLDSLIDMGDRRSVTLEQAEAFRGIQRP